MKRSSVLARRAALAAFLGGLAPVHAQTAVTATPPTPAGDETVTLSPFEVRSGDDTGYRATNTLDGSRLNTALKDTPGAISVFTRDLLDDLGITDVMEILRYDVSAEESFGDDAFAGPGSEQGKAGDMGLGYNWRTRGLQSSSSTNGFNTTGKTDLYNVESVGSTRGPNAILFGSGAAGGVLNFRTKAANPVRNSNVVEFKVGDESTRRASVDFNRALIKNKLAFRAMGLVERRGSYMPHQYTDKDSFTLAAQYRFKKETSVNVSFENTRTEAVRGRPWNVLDSVTGFLNQLNAGQVRWDPVDERYENLNGTVVGAPAGVGALATRTILVQGPDLGVPTLWEGATAAANRSTLATSTSQYTGTRPSVDESFMPLGSTTPSGASEFGITKFNTLMATLNHRWFEKFYMELAFNKSVRDSDANVNRNIFLRADLDYRLPDRSLNPYFFGNGYYFIQTNNLRQTQGYDDKTMRASFSYEVGSGQKWWGEHRFAVMGERHVNSQMSYRTAQVWAGAPYGGTPESANNLIARRRYFKIDGPLANYTTGHNPAGPFTNETFASATVPGRNLTTAWVAVNDQNYDDEITTDSGLFVMQNYLFKRRLVITTGVRRDTIKSTSPNTIRDAATQEFRYGTAADEPAFNAMGGTWLEATSEKGYRHSIGAVLHLTKNFSLTANASNGAGNNRRNRDVLPDHRVPDASKGKGRDYGVNFSFRENKISGSIKRYDSKSIQEGGQGLVEPVFVNTNNDVMASFDHYFRAAGLTALGANAPIGSIDELRTTLFSTADGYLSDRVSEGYEFEMVGNPTRNWTIRANYAYAKRTRTNVLSEGEGWWAARVALWKELDTLYTTRTGRPSIYNELLFNRVDAFTNQTVAQRIADSDRELGATRFREEQGYGNRKHKANVWTRYAFSEGKLKGLNFGGGWRYQSSNVAGINVAAREVYHGNPRSLFDGMVGYSTRGFLGRYREKLGVTYQINVTNLLDDRTINILKINTDTVTGRPYIVQMVREDPRNATLTVRFAF